MVTYEKAKPLGGLGENKLALTTATEKDVALGKTFYSKNRELKTGQAVLRDRTSGKWYNYGSEGIVWNCGAKFWDGIAEKQSDCVLFSTWCSASANRSMSRLISNSQIDLTDISSITVCFDMVNEGAYAEQYFGIGLGSGTEIDQASKLTRYEWVTAPASRCALINQTLTLDTSDISGSYYVYIFGYASTNGGTYYQHYK